MPKVYLHIARLTYFFNGLELQCLSTNDYIMEPNTLRIFSFCHSYLVLSYLAATSSWQSRVIMLEA